MTASEAQTPTAKRPRRWVDAEIARLDPETDYERIVHLIANYKLNEFVMNLNYATGFMANTVPPGGSDAIYWHRQGREEATDPLPGHGQVLLGVVL